VSRCQNGKTIWILLKQEAVSGSGISWAICKSVFLQAGCPSYRSTNRFKALKTAFIGNKRTDVKALVGPPAVH